jgi:hypothetical protein
MSKKKQPVLRYLEALHDVRRTQKATPETSFYGALQNLLTEIGEDFDPELFASPQLKNDGSGAPDFGIFDKNSTSPRLAVEVKPTKVDIYDTASGKQVSKYWNRYGFVLVTNFREFLLVARNGGTGEAVVERRYRISGNSDAFWKAKPTKLAEEHEEGFRDFLEGVYARPAPITRPKDLAADLARHAREAKRRLSRHRIDDLTPLKDAFESALGLSFKDEKGLDFFRSSLVQTLFYGLFSGWMLWRQGLPKHRKPPAFDWKDASDYLALPLIGDLFDEVAKPKRLGELGLREPLELAANSLNRVNHDQFFATFDADHAITLFYEPFLQAFDPELRKQLGVWYTPPEIVTYMVERVDQLLRSELNIENGLADESVYVLDPATGTGSYVVAVAKRIRKTLDEQGHGAMAAAGVKRALMSRVFGFEILPAPYVVAHLQLGVLLRGMGAPLGGKERTGVYLTNALTGWEPPKGVKATSAFKFLQDEQDKAAKVKREAPIIVILGNPPYNGYAGVALDEERDLSTAYRSVKKGPSPEGQGLNDLYVRFFRMAERRIASGKDRRGIVCYISNYRWLDGLSAPGMRESYLEDFDSIYIDCLNGDKFKNGKLTPDGKPDPSVFSTDANREGIETGTSVTTLVRKSAHGAADSIWFRHFWGKTKRDDLLKTLSRAFPGKHDRLEPPWELGYPFYPCKYHPDFVAWPTVEDLMPISFPGVKTSRDGALVDDNRDRLVDRMTRYFSKGVSMADIAEEMPQLAAQTDRFDPHATRTRLLKRGMLLANVVEYAYRPLDERWVYWEPEGKLLDEKRDEYFGQVFAGNFYLFTTSRTRKDVAEAAFVTDRLTDLNMMDSGARGFPMLLQEEAGSLLASAGNGEPHANLSDAAQRYLAGHKAQEDSLFFHVLAITNSPEYRAENEGGLRHSWPRVPLPKRADTLARSTALGRQVADLLLPDRSVTGVTSGKLRPELKGLAIPARLDGEPIDPDEDLEVLAGWGFHGTDNAVMSGKGKALPNEADPDGALDIYINDAVCWRNVPHDVWDMTIGGYPVVKKWLSYREKRVLGRALKSEEMTYITGVVRRLKALLLLGPELDANYRACAKETLALPPKK